MIRSTRSSAHTNSIRFKIRKSRHTILLITLLGSTLLLPSFALCMVARNDPGVASQPQEKTGPRKQEPKLPWERSQQHRIPNLTRPTEKELLVDITEEQRPKKRIHTNKQAAVEY